MTEERISPLAPEDADAALDDVEDATESIEELRAALEEARRAQLRAVADYQNQQRRAKEERTELARYQLTALVLNFLPVLDDLELALESTDDDIADRPWVAGIRLVQQKFRGVLEAAGVQEIHALGQPFAPDKHEAIGHAPGPEGQVVRVLRRGYELDGRVVRAVMVMVGEGESTPSMESEEPQPST